jgi:hypothetical protein
MKKFRLVAGERLWPGDLVYIDPDARESVSADGVTEVKVYPWPRLPPSRWVAPPPSPPRSPSSG